MHRGTLTTTTSASRPTSSSVSTEHAAVRRSAAQPHAYAKTPIVTPTTFCTARILLFNRALRRAPSNAPRAARAVPLGTILRPTEVQAAARILSELRCASDLRNARYPALLPRTVLRYSRLLSLMRVAFTSALSYLALPYLALPHVHYLALPCLTLPCLAVPSTTRILLSSGVVLSLNTGHSKCHLRFHRLGAHATPTAVR